MKRLGAGLIIVAALLTGSLSGQAGASTKNPPRSCLTALDAAEEVFSEVGDAFGVVSEAFAAASNFDTDALNEKADELSDAAARIRPLRSRFDRAAAQCRRGK